MFVREKRIGSYSYLYLVETVRENGKTKQRIIRNLGRKEVVEAGGDLDRLARSAARLSQRSMILSLVVDGSMPNLTCRRIGAPLLFERLWQESGCRAVVEGLLAARRFEFAVERAVFLTVLHRLMVSGSDRACEHWRDDYHIDDIDGLDLHHLYRAMSWLGEELPATEQAVRTHAPRCIKDLVEERLFARQRDLFSELSVVFMDTTTLYFEGRGGDTLGQRGHTKDYRPHLNQMVVGIIMDQNGRPVCSEMWPGNTTDVITLIPVIDRLRQRFAVGRVCCCAACARTCVAATRRSSAIVPIAATSRRQTTSTSRSTSSGLRKTRDMTASMSCAPTCASTRTRRHAALSRATQGRRHLQDDKIHSRHQADLSPNGRSHSRARVLLVPRARPAQGAGR